MHMTPKHHPYTLTLTAIVLAAGALFLVSISSTSLEQSNLSGQLSPAAPQTVQLEPNWSAYEKA